MSDEQPTRHNVTHRYGGEFVSAVQQGDVMAMQFHPEKSGTLGLKLFESFLTGEPVPEAAAAQLAAGTCTSRSRSGQASRSHERRLSTVG